MNITNEDFLFIQKFIKNESGIILDVGKKYIIESKLVPVIEEAKLNSFSELVAKIRTSEFSNIARNVIDALTTNETSFFRDDTPFETLKKYVIPDIMKLREKEKSLKIWSAACATGQEAYSISMLINEEFPLLKSWDLKIFASDISNRMIAKGKNGVFSQVEVNRGLPARMLARYFKPDGSKWHICEDIKRPIEFMVLNLVEAWPPALPKMDIIFLRNVLIYFDIKNRKNIMARIKKILKPDGYMILGVGETAMNVDDAFEGSNIESALWYRLKNKT